MKLYDYPKCAICKKVLHGLPRLNKFRKLSKSKKRVSRIFGGYLCSKCTREVLKEKVRKLFR
jgi:large subunit ribosomal protein L34e